MKNLFIAVLLFFSVKAFSEPLCVSSTVWGELGSNQMRFNNRSTSVPFASLTGDLYHSCKPLWSGHFQLGSAISMQYGENSGTKLKSIFSGLKLCYVFGNSRICSQTGPEFTRIDQNDQSYNLGYIGIQTIFEQRITDNIAIRAQTSHADFETGGPNSIDGRFSKLLIGIGWIE